MAKSADAKDLKSFFAQAECGFKSRPGHQLGDTFPGTLSVAHLRENLAAGQLTLSPDWTGSPLRRWR